MLSEREVIELCPKFVVPREIFDVFESNPRKKAVKILLKKCWPNIEWHNHNSAFFFFPSFNIEVGFFINYPYYKWEINEVKEIDKYTQKENEKYTTLVTGETINMNQMFNSIYVYLVNFYKTSKVK